jgi:hypothetical protein
VWSAAQLNKKTKGERKTNKLRDPTNERRGRSIYRFINQASFNNIMSTVMFFNSVSKD